MRGAKTPVRPTIASQMAAIPVRNQGLTVRTDADGEVLEVALRWNALLRPIAWAMRLPRVRGYRLDGIGREVWDQIDGLTPIESLVDAFAARHRLSFHEARTLLMSYLQLLAHRGLVVIVGLQKPADEARIEI